MISLCALLLCLAGLLRWTFALKPGAGPQGGELLFLCWCVALVWLGIATLATLIAVGGAAGWPGWLRRFAAPVAAGIALVVLFGHVFWRLNEATVPGVAVEAARRHLWIGGGIALLVAAANLLARWRLMGQ